MLPRRPPRRPSPLDEVFGVLDPEAILDAVDAVDLFLDKELFRTRGVSNSTPEKARYHSDGRVEVAGRVVPPGTLALRIRRFAELTGPDAEEVSMRLVHGLYRAARLLPRLFPHLDGTRGTSALSSFACH